MKSKTMPIPVDAEIEEMIRRSAEETGLSLADVMRQGLRHGVPAFTEKVKAANMVRRPKSLEYIDDYPPATIDARDLKRALKEKVRKKYGDTNR